MDADLLDRFGLGDLLALRQMHIQNAILHLSFNLFLIHILREQKCLLELLVGEFAAQVAAMLVALFVLGFLFHTDIEVSFIIHMDLEILLAKTRRSEFHVVLFFIFYYIDGRGGIVCPFHPAVVEEVVENVRQPAISSSTYR